jgi:hypothetical protein
MNHQAEALAEVTLADDCNCHLKPSPVSSFGFIVSFGDIAFSSAVIPDGAGHLCPGVPTQVTLRFMVPDAASHLRPGRRFTFFESGRRGDGQILAPLVD